MEIAPPCPAYLVFDTESVPDGRLLGLVKYPRENLTPEEAVSRARAEASRNSSSGSDFLPVTFQYPVALAVLGVGSDFRPLFLEALDRPRYRPRQIAEEFWSSLVRHERPTLITFNGRGFDVPLLEMTAYRYGLSVPDHFAADGPRPVRGHLDLMDWLTNFGAIRLAGGLNLLCKMLGKPGKMEVTGKQIYPLYLRGEHQRISDYCLFDTLDTYFVFLRTRVLTGELSARGEADLIEGARHWLADRRETYPAIDEYLTGWADWQPWP